MNNISDWLNRADYTAEERRNICAQIMSEAQYWDVHQYLKMLHDSTKRPWVGLTDEEKLHIEIMGGKADVMLAEMVEAKLKEKNT